MAIAIASAGGLLRGQHPTPPQVPHGPPHRSSQKLCRVAVAVSGSLFRTHPCHGRGARRRRRAGPRTVTNVLRTLGLADEPGFAAFHRVLNRNVWSGLVLARTLARALIAALVPDGPIIVDHTLERRRGPCIGPASQYRDAARSSTEQTVTTLRWLTAMLLVEVPFAGRIWGLPMLTALVPSRSWCEAKGRRYRPAWARVLLLRLHRWFSDRLLVAVMDGEFAALELLDALSPYMIAVTRLRLDARLFDPPSERPGSSSSRAPASRPCAPASPTGSGGAPFCRTVAVRTVDRVRQRHGRVVPSRQAGHRDPLGAGPLSRRPARAGSLPVHRCRRARYWSGSTTAGRGR